MRFPRSFVPALILSAMLAVPGLAAAAPIAPGDLDANFGTAGDVINSAGNYSGANDIATDAQGRVLVVSNVTVANSITVWRYTQTGVLDTTFNGTGSIGLYTTYPTPETSHIDVDPSTGNIVVAASGGDSFDVFMLDTTGAPVNAFSGDGQLRSIISGGTASANVGDVMARDGNVYVGCSGDFGTSRRVYVARFTAAGVKDPMWNFGSDQLVMSSPSAAWFGNFARSDNGFVYWSGSYNNGGGLVGKLGALGELSGAPEMLGGIMDPEYASPGQSVWFDGLAWDGTALYAGGKIDDLAGGYRGLIVKYGTATGLPDPSFGSAGTVVGTLQPGDTGYQDLATQDGRIVGLLRFTDGLGNPIDRLEVRDTGTGLLEGNFSSPLGYRDANTFRDARSLAVSNGAVYTAGARGADIYVTRTLGMPKLLSVGVPTSQTYKIGDTLTFTAQFNVAVAVNTAGGSPTLQLDIGGNTEFATLAGPASSDTELEFEYTITAGDLDDNGIVINALALNGSLIEAAVGAGSSADISLPTINTSGVLVDGVRPVLDSTTRVTSNPTSGPTVEETWDFTEPVTGIDSADFGVTDVTGTLTTGSIVVTPNSATSYNVRVNGVGGEGSMRIQLKSAATFTDLVGNAYANGDQGGLSFLITSGVPVATAKRVNANPTTADTVTFKVEFSKPVQRALYTDFEVVATGTAAGTIQVPAPVVRTAQAAGFGNVSSYNVTLENVTGDGTLTVKPKATNGIFDIAHNAVVTSSSNETYTIDNTQPTVLSVGAPKAGNYVPGDVLSFPVTFSEPVALADAANPPVLPVTIGAKLVSAPMVAASNANLALAQGLLQYVVQVGDVDTDGITVAPNFSGGRVADQVGNVSVDAPLLGSVESMAQVKIGPAPCSIIKKSGKSTGCATSDLINGGTKVDTIFGADGDDEIYGFEGNDILSGGRGNDKIDGGANNDRIAGGADDDELLGSSGNDKLFGGTGDDKLFGGTGNDKLSGHAGNDVLTGGAGRDTLVGGEGVDVLKGGAGNDVLASRDGDKDVVNCGPGIDLARVDKQDTTIGCEFVSVR